MMQRVYCLRHFQHTHSSILHANDSGCGERGAHINCDWKSHWGLPEIPRGSAALTGVTRDSVAVGGVVPEKAT